ncbi:hypothetical protein BN961_01940 [Afipia felis]|uniref:Uncharacterized protein n=1 Tax=Afipia felis TaxID=1035 RepID=A0A090MSD3_AFIFE|nr:hypothetical protein BN961_01940 [Afipia felis]
MLGPPTLRLRICARAGVMAGDANPMAAASSHIFGPLNGSCRFVMPSPVPYEGNARNHCVAAANATVLSALTLAMSCSASLAASVVSPNFTVNMPACGPATTEA